MNTKHLLAMAVGALAAFGFQQNTYAECAFANGAKTGSVNFALPALTQSLNPSDAGPRELASASVSAASLASAMGISSTVAIWGGCQGDLIWNPLRPGISGTSPGGTGYISTGIENLNFYLYSGKATTGAFGPFLTPKQDGSAWTRSLTTIHSAIPPWSVMGGVVLVLYQTGPIRQGGVIAAGPVAELKISDGLQVMNMSTSAITVNVLACSITTPVVNVQMPAFYKSSFTGVGSTTAATDFRIGASCDSGVMPTITFSGQTSFGTTDVFAINSGSGAASGVGVQLLYNGNTVQQNTAVAMNTITATGPTEFPFSARYIQTQNTVTSGQADATITFTLNYK